MQGARVWVREKEQLLPATVNSCGDGILVITTDYGEVRNVDTIRCQAACSNPITITNRLKAGIIIRSPPTGTVKCVAIRFLLQESYHLASELLSE